MVITKALKISKGEADRAQSFPEKQYNESVNLMRLLHFPDQYLLR
jgi:hypothetical protein